MKACAFDLIIFEDFSLKRDLTRREASVFFQLNMFHFTCHGKKLFTSNFVFHLKARGSALICDGSQ